MVFAAAARARACNASQRERAAVIFTSFPHVDRQLQQRRRAFQRQQPRRNRLEQRTFAQRRRGGAATGLSASGRWHAFARRRCGIALGRLRALQLLRSLVVLVSRFTVSFLSAEQWFHMFTMCAIVCRRLACICSFGFAMLLHGCNLSTMSRTPGDAGTGRAAAPRSRSKSRTSQIVRELTANSIHACVVCHVPARASRAAICASNFVRFGARAARTPRSAWSASEQTGGGKFPALNGEFIESTTNHRKCESQG